MKKQYCIITFLFILSTGKGRSQVDVTEKEEYKGMVIRVSENKKITLGFTNQVWVRYAATNPGTTVYEDSKEHLFDIGLRRSRVTLAGNPFDKVNLFMQIGMNNFGYLSKRQSEFFFHDAVADYELSDYLSIGSGLTAWGGFSRFSSPSIGSILGVDAPLFAQATNGATDQFLRKLSVYAKGDIDKWSYSIALSKPMAIQQSNQYQPIGQASTFSNKVSNPQIHGYIQYSLLEKESHATPYYKGTYHGKKKVFNIGIGGLFQNGAMQRLNTFGDTIRTNLAIVSVDLFYDVPTKNGGAISLYGAYYNYNFGKNYLRNIGAMNPANGNSDESIVNGAGTASPMIGTGNVGYLQGGYMLPVKEENKDKTRLMPYSLLMLADYDALTDPMLFYDIGLNVLINGHRAKLTLAYQNRPIYKTVGNKNKLDTRKGLVLAQFQVSI